MKNRVHPFLMSLLTSGVPARKLVKRLAGEIICSLHPSKLIDDHNSHDGRRDYAA
jgi:hypothetical protein